MKKFLFTFIFTVLSFFALGNYAHAATTDNVFGYVWSYNVGWISLNSCNNPIDSSTCGSIDYGVKLDTSSNVISGYAWNDVVGWISFNPSDWGACPPNNSGGTCTTYSSFSNKLATGGWARVLSAKNNGTVNGNTDWDGWISLGGNGSNGNNGWGSTYSTTDSCSTLFGSTCTGGVVYSVTKGHWWGSQVMGWIDTGKTPYNSAGLLSKNWGGMYIYKPTTCTGCSMSLTPSGTNVLSGDKVSFSWTVTGFTPTSCTGSGAGNSDWDKTTTVSTKSGSISNILVPKDKTTQYTLKCTDGTNQATASASVTADPLTAGISYGGSCMQSGGTKPSISWTTNDPSPDCTINATPTGGGFGVGNYSFSTSGTSPGTTQDTNFNYSNTYYSMTCTNGPSGTYQASVTTPTPDAYVGMCIANYVVNTNTTCQGSGGAVVSKVTGSNPTRYEGITTLSVTPTNGFTSSISVTKPSGITGTFTLTPTTGFSGISAGGTYGTVDAKLSLTQTQYTNLFNAMSNKVLQTINLTATGSAQNVNSKTVKLNFCDSSATSSSTGSSSSSGTSSSTGSVKPVYKPF